MKARPDCEQLFPILGSLCPDNERLYWIEHRWAEENISDIDVDNGHLGTSVEILVNVPQRLEKRRGVRTMKDNRLKAEIAQQALWDLFGFPAGCLGVQVLFTRRVLFTRLTRRVSYTCIIRENSRIISAERLGASPRGVNYKNQHPANSTDAGSGFIILLQIIWKVDHSLNRWSLSNLRIELTWYFPFTYISSSYCPGISIN